MELLPHALGGAPEALHVLEARKVDAGKIVDGIGFYEGRDDLLESIVGQGGQR